MIYVEPEPLDENLPAELQRIARKTLQKDAGKRYQTVKDLLIDLEDVREELKLQNKLERTTWARREETKTQILNATTADAAHSTSSAEYIATEIKRHKSASIVALLVLLLAISGLGYWFFASRSANALQIESIAVLPFVNETGSADNEYLSDGMTESLIGGLSQLPKLSVKARSSVFRYKGKEVSPQTAGKELSVQAVLLGRVTQRGETLTLNLELVDAQTENIIWSEQYNRKLNEIVTLQSEVARDVSQKLRQRLTGTDEQRATKTYTQNPEAYELYLKGLYHWNKRTPDDLKQAIALFQQAIDKDPAYAKAYAGLALTYAVLGGNMVFTREEGIETLLKAKAAARKALELDNTLAEAYAVLGDVEGLEWDFAGAENDFKRAIELNPSNATAHQWYSELLARLGRNDEALAEVKKAYELDPFSPAVSMNVALRYLEARRYDEAIAQFKKVNQTDPAYPMAYLFLGGAYQEKGMYEEALEAQCKGDVLLKIDTPENCERKKAAIRQAIKKDGATGYWRKDLERLLKEHEQGTASAVSIARVYARLGEKDRAFEWLEKAFAKRDPELSYLKIYESFDFGNIKSDPRFQDLLRRFGLPQ
ncbi:MAG: tetratricopeptide repeat protein [Aridibacter sp.]